METLTRDRSRHAPERLPWEMAGNRFRLLADAHRSSQAEFEARFRPRAPQRSGPLFRASYLANLLSAWIPALDGLEPILMAGANVAQFECGSGAMAVLIARAYPQTLCWGFDSDSALVEQARQAARRGRVDGRVRFDHGRPADFPAHEYDLVASYDCLGRLDDPLGAAMRVRETLVRGGTWLLVEPHAGDLARPEFDRPAPPARGPRRIYAHHLCRRNLGPARDPVSGEAALRALLATAGFRSSRRVARTASDLVLEARR